MTHPTYKQIDASIEWNDDISSAPYGKVLEVINDKMDEPVLATRGWVSRGHVHQNQNFFTSVYTPASGAGLGFPAGQLCIPDRWRLSKTERDKLLKKAGANGE